MGRSKRDGSNRVFATQKEAAKALGITDRALRDWSQKPGFPDCSAGYPEKELREFQKTFRRRGSEIADRATRVQVALNKEKLRQARLKTEDMRREASVADGNLIPRDEYFLFANETITQARDLLLAIPLEMKKHLPRRLHPKTAELARLIEAALKKLAALAEGPHEE